MYANWDWETVAAKTVSMTVVVVVVSRQSFVDSLFSCSVVLTLLFGGNRCYKYKWSWGLYVLDFIWVRFWFEFLPYYNQVHFREGPHISI